MEPEGSSPHSQAPVVFPHTEPDQSIQCSPSHFLKIHFNITYPSTTCSPKWTLVLGFPHQNPLRTSPLPHTSYMLRRFTSSWFDNPNNIWWAVQIIKLLINTLRTGDADLRFYFTTVQDGWRKSAFLTRACFPCTIQLIMKYIEPVSEWSCWRMFIETWPHSELTFRHRASSI